MGSITFKVINYNYNYMTKYSITITIIITGKSYVINYNYNYFHKVIAITVNYKQLLKEKKIFLQSNLFINKGRITKKVQ